MVLVTFYHGIITKKLTVKRMQIIETVVLVISIHLVFDVWFIIMHHPMAVLKYEKITDMLDLMQNHTIPKNKHNIFIQQQ